MENQPAPMASVKKMMPVEELFKKAFNLYWPKAFSMIFLMLILWLVCIVVAAVFGGVAVLMFVQHAVALKLIGALVLLVGVLGIIIVGLWIKTALMFAVLEPAGPISIKPLL